MQRRPGRMRLRGKETYLHMVRCTGVRSQGRGARRFVSQPPISPAAVCCPVQKSVHIGPCMLGKWTLSWRALPAQHPPGAVLVQAAYPVQHWVAGSVGGPCRVWRYRQQPGRIGACPAAAAAAIAGIGSACRQAGQQRAFPHLSKLVRRPAGGACHVSGAVCQVSDAAHRPRILPPGREAAGAAVAGAGAAALHAVHGACLATVPQKGTALALYATAKQHAVPAVLPAVPVWHLLLLLRCRRRRYWLRLC